METLPSEILHKVFLLLHQVDKVECMTVCHHWENLIKTLSLVDTVRLCSRNSVENFALKIKQEHHLGARVKRLIIDYNDYDEGINLDTILPSLTNLHEFMRYTHMNGFAANNGELRSLRKNIKYISEISNTGITNHLLASSICPNLTSLSISSDIRNSILLLKHALSLKTLEIVSTPITIDDIELLHICALNLKSLKLKRVVMEAIEFENEIEPATSISECIFEKCSIDNLSQTRLLQYVGKKYPSLQKFKYFNIGTCVYPNIYSEHEACSLFRDGWEPLLLGLGSQLKALYFGPTVQSDDLLCTLDNAGCQITCLKMKSISLPALRIVTSSDQINYIQNLRLEDVKIANFKFLTHFKTLTKLKLVSSLVKKLKIDMSSLLKYCPSTVQALSFQGIRIILGIKDIGFSSIKKLSFVDINIPTKMDDFISRNIPHLSILKLKLCSLQGRSLILPTVNLLCFCIMDTFPFKVRGIKIYTRRNKKCRWFHVENNQPNTQIIRRYSMFDAPVFSAIKSSPFNEINEEPFFVLECFSVNDVVVFDVW